jgi:flagellar motor component MotA
VRLEFLGTAEAAYFRIAATIIHGVASGAAPKVAIEQARRGMSSEYRLSREELDKLYAEVDAS